MYTPHPGQVPLHDCKARFRIVTSGRRFGKTISCVNEIMKYAWENKGTLSWWTSPSYRQSRISFRLICSNFHNIIEANTKNPMEVKLLNGSLIQFNSTDQADNLRGEGVNFLIVDEAAMVATEAWQDVLRPTLSDTNGRAVIVSTPKGTSSWFYNLWMKGHIGDSPDYKSFKFPTSANPYIAAEEIEEVRNSLPENVFKQEYLAEFLAGGGTVFRDVVSCINDQITLLKDGAIDKNRIYFVGWDLAKHSDYTCVVVVDTATMEVVYFDRFNRVDYNVQIDRVATIAMMFNNAKILLDSTGVGDPILETVTKRGLNADGFLFTNTSKQQLIEHLAVLIERKEISFPDIKVLISELSAFQYEISRAGNMKYGAPTGLHDDTVIALALASWGARHQRNPRVLIL